MPTHPYSFDGARRVAELLLRVQAATPRSVRLHDLASEWDVSWQTVRRLVTVAEEASQLQPAAGALRRSGRGRTSSLTWIPAAETPARRSHRVQAVALAAALGPWQAAGVEDVAAVLRRYLDQTVAAVPADRARALRDILARGFYYQPYMPRQMREPQVVSDILTALFRRCAVHVARYHPPGGNEDVVSIEPWTLVHALDGLYVLGVRLDTEAPRLWALHRMEGVTLLPERGVSLPTRYRPEALLGHGYGPFLSGPGEVRVHVPAAEVPFVLESPLPSQVGEAEWKEDGSAVVTIGTAMHPGLWLWARGMGVTVEDESVRT